MDLREGNNFVACGQAYGPHLGSKDEGQDTAPKNALNPKEGNNFIACGQAYGTNRGFQGARQGVDSMNAMDWNEGNNLGIWNVGGDPELAHEQSRGHGHNGYKAYAVDLGTRDDANTSEFEYMSGQGPPGGHHNADHEGNAFHLNTNVADLNMPEFLGAMEEETAVHEKKIRPSWRKLYKRVLDFVQLPPPGPFDRTNLKWEAKSNQGNGNKKDTQKATIHWAWLHDFLEGEMSTRQFPCTFHEESRQCMNRQDMVQVRVDFAVQEIR